MTPLFDVLLLELAAVGLFCRTGWILLNKSSPSEVSSLSTLQSLFGLKHKKQTATTIKWWIKVVTLKWTIFQWQKKPYESTEIYCWWAQDTLLQNSWSELKLALGKIEINFGSKDTLIKTTFLASVLRRHPANMGPSCT